MSYDATVQATSELESTRYKPLSWRQAGLLAVLSVACFHAAYTPATSGLLAFGIVGYVICLVQLARLRTRRQCYYTGLAVGLACFAPQLECFWRIFGPAAIALWYVLAFWIGLFLMLSHLALVRLGPKRGALLIPFLWTGLEYFRSELYYLKFSWLNVGYAFAESPFIPWTSVGVYGIGFLAAGLFAFLPAISRLFRRKLSPVETIIAIVVVGYLLAMLLFPAVGRYRQFWPPNLRVAGIQLEIPDSKDILPALDRVVAEDKKLVANHIGNQPLTNVRLIVLSEYTLDGEPPDELKDWCRTNQKFLIVGGKEPAPGNNFYDTAFVVSTNGEVVFKQVKSVPIQFFKDGLPALEQKLWESPWGRIGICICYDLSYTRVTDELVRQGAQMLIVPTMDVAGWGRHQHELHARIAPVRAAEYGIPIFRVASSGISQGVNMHGWVQSRAPFPGEGEMIFFGVGVGESGRVPLDRFLAMFCVFVTGAFLLWLAVGKSDARQHRPQPRSSRGDDALTETG